MQPAPTLTLLLGQFPKSSCWASSLHAECVQPISPRLKLVLCAFLSVRADRGTLPRLECEEGAVSFSWRLYSTTLDSRRHCDQRWFQSVISSYQARRTYDCAGFSLRRYTTQLYTYISVSAWVVGEKQQLAGHGFFIRSWACPVASAPAIADRGSCRNQGTDGRHDRGHNT
ncbi:hypothetical protein P280DRAFT_51066 [Massarina eburnea CBS 473.64]|uniref:Uncharacterized protein n=1 Tax=Massarina eburnea CBS 473.64 TaxID=1395130 RepID=A0A6A6RZG7_9PLEO|nr:hypothetical protein P280DRAFT_51066 [Massarina eburnea CBS 473.64]